ncbi:MAG: DMT family transporter [Gemmobacter sp.]
MSPQALGILSAVGAALTFSVNDTAIKFLSGGYALHQLVFIRSVISMLFLLGLILPLAGGWHLLRTRRPGLNLVRGALIFTSNMLFFLALSMMSLAEAVAVFFVAPLLITVFSVVFLGEQVGPRRWAAVAIGFVGVVVILRPGTSAFQLVALLPLLAAACYAAMHTLTRRVGRIDRAETMAVYAQGFFLTGSLAFGLLFGDGRFASAPPPFDFLLRPWIWPPTGDWLVLGAAGLASGIGGYLITQAYRLCEGGLAAPFEYVNMPAAILWGLFVFGEWPDAVAWVGIALISLGGLYMAWREMQVLRRAGPAGVEGRL